MTIYAISVALTGAWYLLLLALTFVAWKHVRHWSAVMIFIAVGGMNVCRALGMIRVYVSQWGPGGATQADVDMSHLLGNIQSVGLMLAYIVGIVGAVGALEALRKRKWSVHALRNPAEAAQPHKGGA